MRGGMRVVAPPDHLDGDRRGVSQPPEDDTVAPVLGRGSLGSDPDAAAGGNDGEPVVDIARVEDARLPDGWPQTGAGGPGAPVDKQGALRYLIERDGAPSSPGVVSCQGAVAALVTDDGASETVAVDGGAQDCDVAQALQPPPRRRGAAAPHHPPADRGRPRLICAAGPRYRAVPRLGGWVAGQVPWSWRWSRW